LQVNALLVLSRRMDAATSVSCCSVPILVSLLFSFLIYRYSCHSRWVRAVSSMLALGCEWYR
jgi:hypothetical protein